VTGVSGAELAFERPSRILSSEQSVEDLTETAQLLGVKSVQRLVDAISESLYVGTGVKLEKL
jgi:hypothetical protein